MHCRRPFGVHPLGCFPPRQPKGWTPNGSFQTGDHRRSLANASLQPPPPGGGSIEVSCLLRISTFTLVRPCWRTLALRRWAVSAGKLGQPNAKPSARRSISANRLTGARIAPGPFPLTDPPNDLPACGRAAEGGLPHLSHKKLLLTRLPEPPPGGAGGGIHGIELRTDPPTKSGGASGLPPSRTPRPHAFRTVRPHRRPCLFFSMGRSSWVFVG